MIRETPYESAVKYLAREILRKKCSEYRDSVMVIGVEGLSNSGKSSFSSNLVNNLKIDGISGSFMVEGDSFHHGRERAAGVYRKILENLELGERIPSDFIQNVWRDYEIQNQILDFVKDFNISRRKIDEMKLERMLKEKRDGTEHSSSYWISKNSIIVLPSLYLRHLKGFDLIVYLEISPETSVRRKIERDKKEGRVRDSELTRRMVERIEWPVMLRQIEMFPLSNESELILDTNDFERVKIKDAYCPRYPCP